MPTQHAIAPGTVNEYQPDTRDASSECPAEANNNKSIKQTSTRPYRPTRLGKHFTLSAHHHVHLSVKQ